MKAYAMIDDIFTHCLSRTPDMPQTDEYFRPKKLGPYVRPFFRSIFPVMSAVLLILDG
jgi:hypothetical protein